MLITSKFDGECKACKRQVRAGDRVSWVKGEKGVTHAACSEEGRALAADLAPSAATDADIEVPAPDGLEYLGYQRAGVAYCLTKGSAIIADEMGLGKTIQAIGLINASPAVFKVIVVCPASVKLNWKRELQKWLARPLSVDIFPAWLETGADICIVNPEQVKKLPPSLTCDLLVLDEAHFFKNPKAARTKDIFALRKRAGRVICLTGTPILNKPIELFPLLQLTAPATWDPAGLKKQELVGEGEGAGFFRFAKRYCDAKEVWIGRKKHWDFGGSSNLPELQEKLRASCMVRRLKADVLPELPSKRRQTIVLDPPKGVSRWLDEERALFGDDLEEAARKGVAFTDISRVRTELALSKAEMVADHVREALEGGAQKIVLFCHHVRLGELLELALADYGPKLITGETPIAKRQAYVDTFQYEPACRVIIGTIGAMGVGLTLTSSSHVVFAELDWTPALVTQAEDRCHRIGQKESVLVQHLVFKGSLDERMLELIVQKQEIADLALDNETLEDVSDRAIVEHRPEPIVSETRSLAALSQLRFLSARCDGARVQDGAGFNGLDTGIGKKLAALAKLSPRQTVLAERILKKYSRQLKGAA